MDTMRTIGGAERQALLLAEELRSTGDSDVAIAALDGPGAVSRVAERIGVEWRVLPSVRAGRGGRGAGELLKFAAALRELRPTILMSYLRRSNTATGLVWRLTGCRRWIWNQRSLPTGADSIGRVGGAVLRRCRQVVANADTIAELLVSEQGVERDAIRVIRNGVRLSPPVRSREEWRNELGVREGQPLVVMISNLTRYKDQATVLRAWREVSDGAEARIAPIFVAAGFWGDTADGLRALAFDLNLGGRVVFPGEIEDVTGLLRAADLAVHSSWAEGSPNCVLEAMAAGCAVVASDIPGNREAMGDAPEECFFPAGDHAALARRVQEWLAVPSSRRELGVRNERRVEREFSVSRMIAEYREVLTS